MVLAFFALRIISFVLVLDLHAILLHAFEVQFPHPQLFISTPIRLHILISLRSVLCVTCITFHIVVNRLFEVTSRLVTEQSFKAALNKKSKQS